jgi:two-component system sensor histidine kinase/response regulator
MRRQHRLMEPIDLNVLAELLGHDVDSVRKFAQLFLTTARDGLHELDAALARGDMARMRELGHKMKTSAQIVGAPRIAALCESLEQLPLDGAKREAALATALVAQLSPLLKQASCQIAEQTGSAGIWQR